MPVLPTATALLPPLHRPPVVASVRVVVVPAHRVVVPLITAGDVMTTSLRSTVQPEPNE